MSLITLWLSCIYTDKNMLLHVTAHPVIVIYVFIIEHSWLVNCLLLNVPLKIYISFIWRRHHCWRRTAKFRLLLDVHGLWSMMDFCRSTHAETRGLALCSLVRFIRQARLSRTYFDIHVLESFSTCMHGNAILVYL